MALQELNELKSAHEQLQVQYQELSQQSKAGAESDEQIDAVAHLTQQLQQANQDLAGQRAKTMALQQVLLCSQPVCAKAGCPNAGLVTAASKVHIELYHCAPCASAKLKAERLAVFIVLLHFAEGRPHADI